MSVKIKVSIVLVIVGAIALLLLYQKVYNKAHMDIEKAPVHYSLSAEKLFEQFVEDPIGANERYIGKVLEISGDVKTIEQQESQRIAVYVFSEGMFGDEGVRCVLLPHIYKDVEHIQLPEQITIKGLCVGFNDTDVILQQCSIK